LRSRSSIGSSAIEIKELHRVELDPKSRTMPAVGASSTPDAGVVQLRGDYVASLTNDDGHEEDWLLWCKQGKGIWLSVGAVARLGHGGLMRAHKYGSRMACCAADVGCAMHATGQRELGAGWRIKKCLSLDVQVEARHTREYPGRRVHAYAFAFACRALRVWQATWSPPRS